MMTNVSSSTRTFRAVRASRWYLGLMFAFWSALCVWGVFAPNNSALQRSLAALGAVATAVLSFRAFTMRVVADRRGVRVHHFAWSWTYPWSSIQAVEIGTGRAMTPTSTVRLRLRDGSVRRLQAIAHYDTSRGRDAVETIVEELNAMRPRAD